MCIMCEIKAGLLKADASVVAEVLPLVEKLSNATLDVLNGVERACIRTGVAKQRFFNEAGLRDFDRAAAMFSDAQQDEERGELIAALTELFGNRDVKIQVVEVNSGADIEALLRSFEPPKGTTH